MFGENGWLAALHKVAAPGVEPGPAGVGGDHIVDVEDHAVFRQGDDLVGFGVVQQLDELGILRTVGMVRRRGVKN